MFSVAWKNYQNIYSQAFAANATSSSGIETYKEASKNDENVRSDEHGDDDHDEVRSHEGDQ